MRKSTVLKLNQRASENEEDKKEGPIEAIRKTFTHEMVIAICGPIGTPSHGVSEIIENILKTAHGYKTNYIRLSEYIKEYGRSKSVARDKTSELITLGNEMRAKDNAILVKKAILDIKKERDAVARDSGVYQDDDQDKDVVIRPEPVVSLCHIIDSIKNAEELALLRMVYGEMLHLISIHSSIENRIIEIKRKENIDDSGVFSLIDRDSGEELANGQSVRKIFPQADFFISLDEGTESEARQQIERYFNLLLGSFMVSPTKHERAMYSAFSAANNSACLSRQVGAAIAEKSGNIISVGWNDVPKAFGGLYEENGSGDKRCYNEINKICHNDDNKKQISLVIANELKNAGMIDNGNLEEVARLIDRSPRFKDLIEYSRAVHAEMHAIINAGKIAGQKIESGSIYITTYPCHYCAKHIVAAGIANIYFIEPYQKSLAAKLHKDSVTESDDDNRVKIRPFIGIAPRRHNMLFNINLSGQERKADGVFKLTNKKYPLTSISLEAIGTLETLAISDLPEIIDEGGVS